MIITKYPKVLHKLSNTIRQAEKVLMVLYLVIQKKRKFFKWKNARITKRKHAFKDFARSYNDEILNYFNPELQLKDIESAIKIKLIDLLTRLKNFKFVTALVLVFKKIESEDKTKYDKFYSSSKAEIIVSESDFDDVFQSFFTTIMTNMQKIFRKRFRLDHWFSYWSNCPADIQYSKIIPWVFTQRWNVPDIQGTFREHDKEKYCLKNYRRKSFFCVKSVWFDDNKCWSFGKLK